jgi:hypothetical protein
MAIRRPESDASGDPDGGEPPAVRITPASGRRSRWLALTLCVGLGAAAARGAPPATPSEPAPILVPAPLGVTRAELYRHFGEALRPLEVTRARSVFEQIAPPAPPGAPPPAGPVQSRLGRRSSGDVQSAEYDLWEGRVYRVRWQLAERFEQPILSDVLPRVSERLGRPDYDQTLRAELGSERDELRRTGWTLDGRTLEIRQLHPLSGGPIFLTLSDVAAMQAIVDAKGVPLPQPETSGAWWRQPQRLPGLPSPQQRRELAVQVDTLVAKLVEAR